MSTILHIAPTPFFSDRGCHIRIEGIVNCLDKLQFENVVCTYHHGRDIKGVNSKRIKPIAAYTQTEAGPSKYKLLADWRLLWLVFREYRRLKPVAIHAHLHEGLLIGLIIKWLFFWRKTPLIADMQGSLTGELETHGVFKKIKLLKPICFAFERLLLLLPNAIACSNQHSVDKFLSELKISPDKLYLTQDGANSAHALNASEKAALKEAFNLPPDKTIVVYSGALLDSKGLEELKELLVNNKNKDAHFLIIGYPTENLEPFVAQHQLAHKCTLTGQVDFERLPDYLRCSDIALDPKNSDAGEGSGKMLNYLACELPVVAFDTKNNRKFLPAESALAENVTELNNQLNELINNADLRAKQRQEIKQYFAANLSWHVTKEQLQKLYSKLELLKTSSS